LHIQGVIIRIITYTTIPALEPATVNYWLSAVMITSA